MDRSPAIEANHCRLGGGFGHPLCGSYSSPGLSVVLQTEDIRGAQKSRPAARIAIEAEFGWRHAREGDVTVWAKGYGRGADAAKLARRLAEIPKLDIATLASFLSGLDGHFAIAATGPKFSFAAVDWVRSIPVGFARCGGEWIIDDQALRLRSRAGLTERDIDGDAALAIAMSGYAIDVATLYHGLQQLGPGEFGSIRRERRATAPSLLHL